MLKLAEHILQSKESDFDPLQFVGHCEEAEMLRKASGYPGGNDEVSVTAAKRRQSDGCAAAQYGPRSARRHRRIRAASASKAREMLLPIPGKKGGEGGGEQACDPTNGTA
jgi:hypothetical protein